MPLDRRIVVTITGPGHRNEFGEYVEGVPVDYPVWADRMSAGSTDELDESNHVRVRTIVSWRVRWFAELSGAAIDRTAITAEGATWNVETIDESDERRRFLNLQAVRVIS